MATPEETKMIESLAPLSEAFRRRFKAMVAKDPSLADLQRDEASARDAFDQAAAAWAKSLGITSGFKADRALEEIAFPRLDLPATPEVMVPLACQKILGWSRLS